MCFATFAKMMEFLRFYKVICLSGDFLVAKRPTTTTLAHVHLEQGLLIYSHFWGSRNICFSYTFFLKIIKNHQLFPSQLQFWVASFASLFSIIFSKSQKCEFGAHPKYWKIDSFFPFISLGPGRGSRDRRHPLEGYFSINFRKNIENH